MQNMFYIFIYDSFAHLCHSLNERHEIVTWSDFPTVPINAAHLLAQPLVSPSHPTPSNFRLGSFLVKNSSQSMDICLGHSPVIMVPVTAP